MARAASFLYAGPNVSELPVRPGSCIPYLYYCDPIEGLDPLGNHVEPTTVIDITAQLERKTEMLACHRSQQDWLRSHHGIDEYLEAMKRHTVNRGGLLGMRLRPRPLSSTGATRIPQTTCWRPCLAGR